MVGTRRIEIEREKKLDVIELQVKSMRHRCIVRNTLGRGQGWQTRFRYGWLNLSVEEHRALSVKANGSVQSVGEAVLEIAKLGGWRQSHAPLGVKVIWRGLYALQFLTMGFSLALSQKNMRQG